MSKNPKQKHSSELHIGLDQKQRHTICEGMCRLLADTYLLYIKTQNFHWNVTGPHFASLHLLFEKQYQDMAEAVDDIAERIRALGEFAPASYKRFQELGSIKEENSVPSAKEMIAQLVEGQEMVINTARELLAFVEESDDQPTLDLLTDRMRTHEKNAWMLRSLLE